MRSGAFDFPLEALGNGRSAIGGLFVLAARARQKRFVPGSQRTAGISVPINCRSRPGPLNNWNRTGGDRHARGMRMLELFRNRRTGRRNEVSHDNPTTFLLFPPVASFSCPNPDRAPNSEPQNQVIYCSPGTDNFGAHVCRIAARTFSGECIHVTWSTEN